MGALRKESPSAAFGLALAGGIVIVIAGLLVSLVGAVLTFFIAGIGGVFGLVGVLWGILIIVFAVLLRAMPSRHVGLGVAIILFSVFSWVGSFGGFLIGFLLAFVGGILAIVWRPEGIPVNVTVTGPSPTAATPVPSPTPTKYCPNCGSPVDAGERFCKKCGKVL